MTTSKKISLGDLEFDYRVCGDEKDELVVFLHGFPETSIMWTQLMPEIAALGFFCVAPDMRGYSKNACPKGVSNYTIEKISNDILEIADTLKPGTFHLVGHDWGAAIGWDITYNHPERILSWTSLSVPHSRAFGKALKVDKEQKKMSRYIGFFLVPFLPELVIRRNDFKVFRKLWKRSTPEVLENYLSVFRRKDSLTGALNYYRANFRKGRQTIGDVDTPTLFIWGNRDFAIGSFGARLTRDFIKGDYTFLEVDGGHWLVQSNFDEVKEALGEHLSKNSTQAEGS
ncbi:alpha/beta fold hydrolase [Robiginitalea sp.]|uniref:alpha/beta fold hydrolase n=1 Tax=Robiginitalea sp. TaxID=1902411 RepID=UPI003C757EEF